MERKEEGCSAKPKVTIPHYQLDTCNQYAEGSDKLEQFQIMKLVVAEGGLDIDLRCQAGREHAMRIQRALGGCIEGTGDERFGRSAAVKAGVKETLRRGAELMQAVLLVGTRRCMLYL